ncbi:MAG: Repeat-containing protein [Candidatus Levybacteria bacterium GW2011_GWA1_37_16]|nr:MAG: Repeat-containing protein [Candidatus Levybacteria bacterium GW2011_GWA1_37_16]
MNFFRKFRDFVVSPSQSRTMGILVMLVLVSAVSLTVVASQQQQTLKQRAATSDSCQRTKNADVALCISLASKFTTEYTEADCIKEAEEKLAICLNSADAQPPVPDPNPQPSNKSCEERGGKCVSSASCGNGLVKTNASCTAIWESCCIPSSSATGATRNDSNKSCTTASGQTLYDYCDSGSSYFTFTPNGEWCYVSASTACPVTAPKCTGTTSPADSTGGVQQCVTAPAPVVPPPQTTNNDCFSNCLKTNCGQDQSSDCEGVYGDICINQCKNPPVVPPPASCTNPCIIPGTTTQGTCDGSGTCKTTQVNPPPATADTTAPDVSLIIPVTAAVNVSQVFSVTASDKVGVTACSLWADGINAGAMTISGSNASRSHTFTTAGSHNLKARCNDAANNFASGTDTLITVFSSILTPPAAPPPATATTVTLGLSLNIQDAPVTTDTLTANFTFYNNLASPTKVIANVPATLTFAKTDVPGKKYSVSVALTNLQPDKYFIVIRKDSMIAKAAFTVSSANGSVPVPTTTLVFGDIDNNNDINILDYNILKDCWWKKTATDACASSDFDKSGGAVDQIDFNTLMRGWATWNKEGKENSI